MGRNNTPNFNLRQSYLAVVLLGLHYGRRKHIYNFGLSFTNLALSLSIKHDPPVSSMNHHGSLCLQMQLSTMMDTFPKQLEDTQRHWWNMETMLHELMNNQLNAWKNPKYNLLDIQKESMTDEVMAGRTFWMLAPDDYNVVTDLKETKLTKKDKRSNHQSPSSEPTIAASWFGSYSYIHKHDPNDDGKVYQKYKSTNEEAFELLQFLLLLGVKCS